jgi:hypothetical protein
MGKAMLHGRDIRRAWVGGVGDGVLGKGDILMVAYIPAWNGEDCRWCLRCGFLDKIRDRKHITKYR